MVKESQSVAFSQNVADLKNDLLNAIFFKVHNLFPRKRGSKFKYFQGLSELTVNSRLLETTWNNSTLCTVFFCTV